MPPRSQLSSAPPQALETALKQLGANLRTARLRRNLSLADLASKIGVDRHVVSDAESGKLGTSVGVYVGMLWAMNLLPTLNAVAEPRSDEEGLALAGLDERERARAARGPSNAF
ncbi:MAG: helix-turn-helix domain-containing protein [Xanthobacteraceae bacterium]|nr:helix-turn-helix domain-containing protein [Xanthobacteraceae bacterium]